MCLWNLILLLRLRFFSRQFGFISFAQIKCDVIIQNVCKYVAFFHAVNRPSFWQKTQQHSFNMTSIPKCVTCYVSAFGALQFFFSPEFPRKKLDIRIVHTVHFKTIWKCILQRRANTRNKIQQIYCWVNKQFGSFWLHV